MPAEPNATDPTAVVHSDCVRLSGESVRIGAPLPPPQASPTVELIREGGVIRALEITCGCGEKIRVLCEYD